MLKYILQLMMAGFVILFSTLAAWYEGSAIIENSLEWNYTTPFTQLLDIKIVTGKEIVVLDYFVYALKFQPLFPVLNLLSFIYMIGLTLVFIGKSNIDLSIKLAFTFGLIGLVISSLFFNSTTTGASLFFYILLISALVPILISIIFFFKQNKTNITEKQVNNPNN